MASMSIKEARKQLSGLVHAAERGKTVILTRRGKRVARIAPVAGVAANRLPDLAAFRASVKLKGEPLSQTVIARRGEERY